MERSLIRCILFYFSFFLFLFSSAGFAQTSFSVSNKTTGDTLLTIDNDGRVGLHTTKPEATLDIRSFNPDNNAVFRLGNSGLSHYLSFYSGREMYPDPFVMWNSGDALRFGTSFSNEYMRLTSGGNLGIGITDPLTRLDVFGALRISATHTLPDQTNYGLFLSGWSGDDVNIGKIYVGDNTGWRFNFSSRIDGTDTDLMTIHDDGKVSIGIPNPSDLLEVNGTIRSASGGFRFPDGSLQSSAASSTGNTLDQAYDAGGPGAGRVITADAGSVEIHDGGLYVEQAVETAGGLLLTGSGSEGGQAILFDGDQAGGWIVDNFGDPDQESLRFFRDGEENPQYDVVTLSPAGNVGIGTSVPLTKMHVEDVDLSLPGEALLNELVTVEDYDAGLGLYSNNDGGYGSVLSMGEIVDGSLNNKWSLFRTTSTANPANQLRLSFGNSANYSTNPTLWSLSANGRMGIGTTDPWSGLHLKGDQYPNSFLFIEAAEGHDSGIRIYEGSTPQWHMFNSAAEGGLRIYNSTGANTVFFAEQNTGDVGIGTTNPRQKFEVVGTIYSSNGGFMFPDGTTQTTAASGGGDGNTLDEAYDQGGAGSGRTITADAGAVTVAGTDGFLATGSFGSGTIPVEGGGTRMMWYPAKAAFRSGLLSSTRFGAWNADSIGTYSAAIGYDTRASGTNGCIAMGYGTRALAQTTTALGFYTRASAMMATAMGNYTRASGQSSTAMGWETVASATAATAMGYQTDAEGYASVAMGDHSVAGNNWATAMGYYTVAEGAFSTAMGRETTASGTYATSIGSNTNAQAYCSTVLGRYNVGGGTSGSWISTDPIFEIGIGTSSSSRANAVTVRKNGYMEIGSRVITPVLQITGGSDLSEQFNINETVGEISPGMVVSINSAEPGELTVSSCAYDRKVAGILSGAGGIETGMLMGQKNSVANGEHPVALSGRVYCWADASNGPIEPGDLLTTSDKPGHAMKVTDFARAQGAILGKAMSPLKEGCDLVLVLVTLQ